MFFEDKKHIEKYSLNAPPLPTLGHLLNSNVSSHLARITVTYHDVFSRKHASIFDYIQYRGWQKIEFLPNILF